MRIYTKGKIYPQVKVKGHPRADEAGRVLEHIVIIEKALGKYFSEPHEAHHVDGDKHNNENSNLVACENQAYHMFLHRRTNGLKFYGNVNARKCSFCGEYDLIGGDMMKIKRHNQNGDYYHKSCKKVYDRLSYLKNRDEILLKLKQQREGD